ncbi:hypothetical protein BB559_002636 [Furculomyces boomerangus]|uniref:E3 ubiquitin-protein ligase listerin N-terminal domain-containing protein n=1 Tax=Furculomyces boomerangus TaxID=61424 RepID=A0A2T9YTQ3_9FUNG|nr:hypothetical protein BB559_002636 [Furculomyces boomerangus]
MSSKNKPKQKTSSKATSSRAAEILGKNSLAVNAFKANPALAFTQLSQKSFQYSQHTEQYSSDLPQTSKSPPILVNPDSPIDSSIAVLIKRIGKKDSTTRLKALDDLFSYTLPYISQDSSQNIDPIINGLLLGWPSVFSKQVLDIDRKIRFASLKVHANFVLLLTNKKSAAKCLKQIMGPWICSFYDSSTEASKISLSSFESSFAKTPEQKTRVLEFCLDEILDYLKTNFNLDNPPQKYEIDLQEISSQNQMVVQQSLRALEYLINNLPNKLISKFNPILNDISMWKNFIFHKTSNFNITKAAFACFSAWMKKLDSSKLNSNTLDNNTKTSLENSNISNKNLDSSIENSLEISILFISFSLECPDPSYHTFMWDAILLATKNFPQIWNLPAIKSTPKQKSSTKKKNPDTLISNFIQFLSKGYANSVPSITYPSILVLLHLLPTEILFLPYEPSVNPNIHSKLAIKNKGTKENTENIIGFIIIKAVWTGAPLEIKKLILTNQKLDQKALDDTNNSTKNTRDSIIDERIHKGKTLENSSIKNESFVSSISECTLYIWSITPSTSSNILSSDSMDKQFSQLIKEKLLENIENSISEIAIIAIRYNTNTSSDLEIKNIVSNQFFKKLDNLAKIMPNFAKEKMVKTLTHVFNNEANSPEHTHSAIKLLQLIAGDIETVNETTELTKEFNMKVSVESFSQKFSMENWTIECVLSLLNNQFSLLLDKTKLQTVSLPNSIGYGEEYFSDDYQGFKYENIEKINIDLLLAITKNFKSIIFTNKVYTETIVALLDYYTITANTAITSSLSKLQTKHITDFYTLWLEFYNSVGFGKTTFLGHVINLILKGPQKLEGNSLVEKICKDPWRLMVLISILEKVFNSKRQHVHLNASKDANSITKSDLETQMFNNSRITVCNLLIDLLERLDFTTNVDGKSNLLCELTFLLNEILIKNYLQKNTNLRHKTITESISNARKKDATPVHVISENDDFSLLEGSWTIYTKQSIGPILDFFVDGLLKDSSIQKTSKKIIDNDFSYEKTTLEFSEKFYKIANSIPQLLTSTVSGTNFALLLFDAIDSKDKNFWFMAHSSTRSVNKTLQNQELNSNIDKNEESNSPKLENVIYNLIDSFETSLIRGFYDELPSYSTNDKNLSCNLQLFTQNLFRVVYKYVDTISTLLVKRIIENLESEAEINENSIGELIDIGKSLLDFISKFNTNIYLKNQNPLETKDNTPTNSDIRNGDCHFIYKVHTYLTNCVYRNWLLLEKIESIDDPLSQDLCNKYSNEENPRKIQNNTLLAADTQWNKITSILENCVCYSSFLSDISSGLGNVTFASKNMGLASQPLVALTRIHTLITDQKVKDFKRTIAMFAIFVGHMISYKISLFDGSDENSNDGFMVEQSTFFNNLVKYNTTLTSENEQKSNIDILNEHSKTDNSNNSSRQMIGFDVVVYGFSLISSILKMGEKSSIKAENRELFNLGAFYCGTILQSIIDSDLYLLNSSSVSHPHKTYSWVSALGNKLIPDNKLDNGVQKSLITLVFDNFAQNYLKATNTLNTGDNYTKLLLYAKTFSTEIVRLYSCSKFGTSHDIDDFYGYKADPIDQIKRFFKESVYDINNPDLLETVILKPLCDHLSRKTILKGKKSLVLYKELDFNETFVLVTLANIINEFELNRKTRNFSSSWPSLQYNTSKLIEKAIQNRNLNDTLIYANLLNSLFAPKSDDLSAEKPGSDNGFDLSRSPNSLLASIVAQLGFILVTDLCPIGNLYRKTVQLDYEDVFFSSLVTLKPELMQLNTLEFKKDDENTTTYEIDRANIAAASLFSCLMEKLIPEIVYKHGIKIMFPISRLAVGWGLYASENSDNDCRFLLFASASKLIRQVCISSVKYPGGASVLVPIIDQYMMVANKEILSSFKTNEYSRIDFVYYEHVECAVEAAKIGCGIMNNNEFIEQTLGIGGESNDIGSLIINGYYFNYLKNLKEISNLKDFDGGSNRTEYPGSGELDAFCRVLLCGNEIGWNMENIDIEKILQPYIKSIKSRSLDLIISMENYLKNESNYYSKIFQRKPKLEKSNIGEYKRNSFESEKAFGEFNKTRKELCNSITKWFISVWVFFELVETVFSLVSDQTNDTNLNNENDDFGDSHNFGGNDYNYSEQKNDESIDNFVNEKHGLNEQVRAIFDSNKIFDCIVGPISLIMNLANADEILEQFRFLDFEYSIETILEYLETGVYFSNRNHESHVSSENKSINDLDITQYILLSCQILFKSLHIFPAYMRNYFISKDFGQSGNSGDSPYGKVYDLVRYITSKSKLNFENVQHLIQRYTFGDLCKFVTKHMSPSLVALELMYVDPNLLYEMFTRSKILYGETSSVFGGQEKKIGGITNSEKLDLWPKEIAASESECQTRIVNGKAFVDSGVSVTIKVGGQLVNSVKAESSGNDNILIGNGILGSIEILFDAYEYRISLQVQIMGSYPLANSENMQIPVVLNIDQGKQVAIGRDKQRALQVLFRSMMSQSLFVRKNKVDRVVRVVGQSVGEIYSVQQQTNYHRNSAPRAKTNITQFVYITGSNQVTK